MKKLNDTLLIMLSITGLCHGAIVFEDDFTTDGDLTKWTHPNKNLLVSRGDIVVTGGQLFMDGPNGSAGGNNDDIYDAVLRSVDTFNFTGAFSMSFDLKHDIRETGARNNVRVSLPGGLEMTWWDFENRGQVYYQGTLLTPATDGDGLDRIANGARSESHSFTMAQDGLNVEIFKNAVSIFSTSVAAAPDFDAYSEIVLFSKFHSNGSTEIDNVSVIPEPSTYAMVLLTGAAYVLFRKRKNR